MTLRFPHDTWCVSPNMGLNGAWENGASLVVEICHATTFKNLCSAVDPLAQLPKRSLRQQYTLSPYICSWDFGMFNWTGTYIKDKLRLMKNSNILFNEIYIHKVLLFYRVVRCAFILQMPRHFFARLAFFLIWNISECSTIDSSLFKVMIHKYVCML